MDHPGNAQPAYRSSQASSSNPVKVPVKGYVVDDTLAETCLLDENSTIQEAICAVTERVASTVSKRYGNPMPQHPDSAVVRHFPQGDAHLGTALSSLAPRPDLDGQVLTLLATLPNLGPMTTVVRKAKEIRSLKDKNADLQAQNIGLQRETPPGDGPPELASILADVYKKVKDLEATIEGLRTENQNYAAKDQERAAKDQERVAKDQERAAKDQERVAKDQERVAKDQERAAKDQEHAAEIQKLKSANQGFKVKIENLESDGQELKTGINDLQAENQALKKENQDIRKKLVEYDRGMNESLCLATILGPIHILVLLDDARSKIVEQTGYDNWDALYNSRPLQALVEFISQHVHLGADVTRFVCRLSDVRREGNKAAHRAKREDVRSAVLRMHDGTDRDFLERLYKFVYGEDV